MSILKDKFLSRLRLVILANVLTGCATLGPQLEWGAQYTTPGTQLSFQEVRGSPASPLVCFGIKDCPPVTVRLISYRLRASGFPQGRPLTLWMKRLGRPPQVVRSDIFIDESGTVVQRDEFGPFPMETGGMFVKGEPHEVALISADQNIRAFAKIVPFPGEASEGRCLLTLELLSTKGDAFAISGQGFEANEEIVTVSQYTQDKSDRVETRYKMSPDGKFVILEFPPVTAKQRGAANFTAIGKSCKPTLNYEWGVPLPPEPARL